MGASGNRLFWVTFAVIALISAVSDITKFADLPPQFIGHADQANTAIVARNIAEGKGAVVDVIWILTNGGIPGNEIPIPEPYWSIYVAGIVSFFFFLFGSSLTSMLVPAVLMKISIAAIASGITLRFTKSAYAAFAVAVPLLYHPMLTQRVNGLSDIYLTFFVLSSAIILAYAISRNSIRFFLLVGLLIGIAIGVKSSGLLLLGLLIGYLVFSGQAVVASGRLVVATIGLVLGLLPLTLHNYHAFDSVVSPGSILVKEGGRIRLSTLDFNAGFFSPDSVSPGETSFNLQTRLAVAKMHFEGFSRAVAKGFLVPLYFFPFLILGVFFVVFSIRSIFLYKDTDVEHIFSYISVQILIAALVLACAVHWEARYWNFAVPFIVILSVLSVTRLTKNRVILAALCATITVGSLWSYADELRSFKPRGIPRHYERVVDILPRDAIVFSSDPWEFSFHTRLKSVMLPYTDSDEVLKTLSKRYGVGYIVIMGDQIRHPKL